MLSLSKLVANLVLIIYWCSAPSDQDLVTQPFNWILRSTQFARVKCISICLLGCVASAIVYYLRLPQNRYLALGTIHRGIRKRARFSFIRTQRQRLIVRNGTSHPSSTSVRNFSVTSDDITLSNNTSCYPVSPPSVAALPDPGNGEPETCHADSIPFAKKSEPSNSSISNVSCIPYVEQKHNTDDSDSSDNAQGCTINPEQEPDDDLSIEEPCPNNTREIPNGDTIMNNFSHEESHNDHACAMDSGEVPDNESSLADSHSYETTYYPYVSNLDRYLAILQRSEGDSRSTGDVELEFRRSLVKRDVQKKLKRLRRTIKTLERKSSQTLRSGKYYERKPDPRE